MRFYLVSFIWTYAALVSAAITWQLQKNTGPTADQTDAYTRIETAVSLAAQRYNQLSTNANKSVTVQYIPDLAIPAVDYNGTLSFGANRSYMDEVNTLHEISHILGIGMTPVFATKCAANDWPTANSLIRSWDGPSARIHCGGGHIWPYGLNLKSEMSETNANRHCQLVDAMLADGMASG
jgi:hypothetical protein